jgi:hypothetical protein
MNSSYPKGSVWRKWDLHVHSPKTHLANRYGGDESAAWAAFVERIKTEQLVVIGLTNYFFFDVDEVEKTREELAKANVQCTVLPNIEVRIADRSGPQK